MAAVVVAMLTAGGLTAAVLVTGSSSEDGTGSSSTDRGTRPLNTGRLETEIASGIERQTNVDIRSVECPERGVKAGDVFTCTATAADGDSADVQVTQQDDEGNVRWRLES